MKSTFHNSFVNKPLGRKRVFVRAMPNPTSRKIRKQTQGDGTPHEFRVEENEGHGFARVEALIQEVKIALEYLKKTLGT